MSRGTHLQRNVGKNLFVSSVICALLFFVGTILTLLCCAFVCAKVYQSENAYGALAALCAIFAFFFCGYRMQGRCGEKPILGALCASGILFLLLGAFSLCIGARIHSLFELFARFGVALLISAVGSFSALRTPKRRSAGKRSAFLKKHHKKM